MKSQGNLPHDQAHAIMKSELQTRLSGKVLARKPDYKIRGNRMSIYLDGLSGSHYEICYRRNYHEIALHFQSTPERSLERRTAFDPHIKDLSRIIGRVVHSGPLENKGWMRIWIEQDPLPITELLVDHYLDIFLKLIEETFPILEMVYIQEAIERK